MTPRSLGQSERPPSRLCLSLAAAYCRLLPEAEGDKPRPAGMEAAGIEPAQDFNRAEGLRDGSKLLPGDPALLEIPYSPHVSIYSAAVEDVPISYVHHPIAGITSDECARVEAPEPLGIERLA
jgi:hypothetical protein